MAELRWSSKHTMAYIVKKSRAETSMSYVEKRFPSLLLLLVHGVADVDVFGI